MKQMNIRAEAALLEVARRHHTTVDEVRREIRLAMAMAMCNPAPAARKIWSMLFKNFWKYSGSSLSNSMYSPVRG